MATFVIEGKCPTKGSTKSFLDPKSGRVITKAASIEALITPRNVPASSICLEITESAIMDDPERALSTLEHLHAMGFKLSIDDFGTGYSSLSYLRRLPARQLKIDRSFVRDLDSSLDAQAIVEAVVRLAHALGLKVVAEGVERAEQVEMLQRLDCDIAQGYYFSRPIPAEAVPGFPVRQPAERLRPLS